jgi:hypothetical protein
MALWQYIGVHLRLFLAPKATNIFLGGESGADFNLFAYSKFKNKLWIVVSAIGTYDPSGLLDSGMTRSKVLGSRAIPATDLSGFIGGSDMLMNILWQCLEDEDGGKGEKRGGEKAGEWRSLKLPYFLPIITIVF